jgi:hypothetical protein
MSDTAIQLAAAVEAVAACERLAAHLPFLAAQLDHAAAIARNEWEGPHRETFDHRVAVIDRALHDAASTLLVLRARVHDQSTRHR